MFSIGTKVQNSRWSPKPLIQIDDFDISLQSIPDDHNYLKDITPSPKRKSRYTNITDMVWEKRWWILHPYMKLISGKSKALAPCTFTKAPCFDFTRKHLNVFSQRVGWKLNWYPSLAENMTRTCNINRAQMTFQLLHMIQLLITPLVQSQMMRWKATTPERLTITHSSKI